MTQSLNDIVGPWRPHHIIPGVEIIKFSGHSLIRGELLGPGIEVMEPCGDIRQHLSEDEVLKLLRRNIPSRFIEEGDVK